jgi:hypothetical protein
VSGLHLPRHRGTTANVSSAYPFAAESDLGAGGAYLGTNILTGGAGFAFDPFEAYRAGLVTNPNVLIAGEPGTGKSATAKCIVYRACGAFGRWVAIADPKGEYLPLADARRDGADQPARPRARRSRSRRRGGSAAPVGDGRDAAGQRPAT